MCVVCACTVQSASRPGCYARLGCAEREPATQQACARVATGQKAATFNLDFFWPAAHDNNLGAALQPRLLHQPQNRLQQQLQQEAAEWTAAMPSSGEDRWRQQQRRLGLVDRAASPPMCACLPSSAARPGLCATHLQRLLIFELPLEQQLLICDWHPCNSKQVNRSVGGWEAARQAGGGRSRRALAAATNLGVAQCAANAQPSLSLPFLPPHPTCVLLYFPLELRDCAV